MIRYSVFCCLGYSVVGNLRALDINFPYCSPTCCLFFFCKYYHLPCNIQGTQILNHYYWVYGIFPIGQPDKNIVNFLKWPIYVISVYLLIVMSRACWVVFLICLSSSCVPNAASFASMPIVEFPLVFSNVYS